MIKTQLEKANRIWSDELPSVLWAYRTITYISIGKTPFCLTYGSEVVIPAEVGLTNYRVAHHDEGRNEEGMRLQLDLLDEVRAMVVQWIARYQDLMAKYYSTNVKSQHFQVGELVLRNMMIANIDPKQGKLGPN